MIKASPYTKLFWNEFHLDPNRSDYNIVFDQRIRGSLDIEKLNLSLQKLISEHFIFNSHLVQKDEEVFWEENELINKLEIYDYSDISRIREWVSKPFHIEKEPLYRFGLFNVSRNEYDLVWVFHHALIDGNLFDELIDKISRYYNNNYSNNISIKKQQELYLDYTQSLDKKISNTKTKYMWKELLNSCVPKLNFPSKDENRENSIGEYNFSISVKQLNLEFLKDIDLSLFNVLITLYGYLLSRYFNQEDNSSIGIAYPVSMNKSEDFYLGAQLNTLTFPFDKRAAKTFKDLFLDIKESLSIAVQNKYLPTSEIISCSPISELNASFAQTNFKDKSIDLVACKSIAHNRFNIDIGSSELSLQYSYNNDGITFKCLYRKDIFNNEFILKFCNSYQRLVNDILDINGLDIKLESYNPLSEEDYQRVIYDWNETDKDYPRDKTIYQLFEEQIEKSPNGIALVFEDQELTYKELNERSNQLARYIRKQYKEVTNKELKPDTLIPLCVERSLDMVIAILAVIKAGGAYVPMDPEYPKERFKHILADTNAKLVITQSHLEYRLKEVTDILSILIEDQVYKEEDKANLGPQSKSTDLAYVIYTSGTTGLPKGVMIEHKSLVNRCLYMNKFSEINQEDIFLFKTSYLFDVSISDIFTHLIVGARLIIAKKEFDPNEIEKIFLQHKVTSLHCVPSQYNLLNSYINNYSLVKKIYFSGEVIDSSIISNVYKNKKAVGYNYYGPTETGEITSTNLDIKKTYSIGSVFSNSKAYILDLYGRPVPIGVIGELYIGGAGLARGYLNRPELTAERFVYNPFATESDIAKGYTRLYKTGDLVRWLPDGNIEYIGRNDFQVKIRGYRIELGEIESQLSKLNGIRQSVVLAKENTETKSQYLVGYYVPEKLGVLKQEALLEELSEVLPEYMVPSVLVELENFPLTVNGKLDRKALPDPDFVDEDNYVAPSGELESKACTIFAEVLGLDISQTSTSVNFFRMGGNSILSIKLKQKLNQIEEFKDITVADIFTYNTVKALVNKVSSASNDYNLPSLTVTQSHEIAIIGTSGIFTGSNTVEQLWRLLESNKEALEFLSIDECRKLGVPEELLSDADYVPVSGRVKGIDLFDPSFWGMSPNEAKQLDPQIRKFIEHCWYALEQSGYSQSRKENIIGVFAGIGVNNSYHINNILSGELKDEINLWEVNASNSKDALATKAAYLLGLTGPAHSVNTACSTGLVSVVDACRNLSLNTCNIAIAGGVSLLLPDQAGYVYQEGMILSDDGRCKTFDANANGTTSGSGVGAILLKRLDDAIEGRDNILGVIKGYATNNDGDRKSGYTAPSMVGQSECIIAAQKMAGVDVNDIDYVECHGTATKLGDPIEVQALQEAFKHNGYSSKDKKVILGAIKANIGHTDSAAGTAGLIKVTEMFRHDLIPCQPNFNKPNPELNIESTLFEISKTNIAWLSNKSKPRLAGVSAFGVGGTNAHVIVSDYYQEAKQVISDDNQEYIIPITAKSRKSLLDYQKALASYLENNNISLRDLSYTLTYRREHFNYRTSLVVRAKEDLIEQLNTKTTYAEMPQEEDNIIVFMFPGQGNQYLGMAKELYQNDKTFHEIVDKTIEITNRYLEKDLKNVLFNKTSNQINQTEWSQICLFVVEYSLAKYLNTLNIKADAYIGHSIGEYVAATLAEVFNLEDAIKLVIARGRCMQAMPEGSMLSINANKEEIQSYIQQSNCEIAVINSIEDIVASGKDEDIDNLHNLLKHKAIPSIKLNTSHAYHSKLMEEASNSFKKAFEGIQINIPKQTIISNITGEVSKEEVTTPEYWQKQIRNTVEFAKGIEILSNKYNNRITFIEVGPGKSSISFVEKYKKHINSRTTHTVQLLPSQKQRAEWDIGSQQSIEAILWQNNLQKNINKQIKQNSNLITNLPTYQFDFQSCWVNKLPRITSQDELSILPESKWYSTIKWTLEEDIKDNSIFKLSDSLVFISDNSEKLLFKDIASNALFVKLDLNVKDFVYDNNQITINPVIENHYKELSDHVGTIKNIIHIASHKNKAILEDNLSYGFYSLFLIKKHLLSVKSFERLLVLTSGLFSLTDNDYISASNGSMVGAIRNINHENLDLNSQIIDIGDSENISGILSTLSKEAYSKSENSIAIRFNKLWQEKIANITLEKNKQATIENKDTIFVTGGLGGVALSTALEISKHHNDIHFILSSRTDITKQEVTEYIQKKLNILEQIKTNKCSFEILAMDISDEITIKQLESKNIHGIIHTAGVEPLTLDKNSLEDIRGALKAKVYGIENILDIIDINKLRFIAMTSSLASIMGDTNRFEYCASNSYLDYLVKDSRFKNTKIISVNWPGWLDTGMAKDYKGIVIKSKTSNKLQKLINNNAFKAENGAQIFYNSINNDYSQIILSRLSIKNINRELFNKENLIKEEFHNNIEIIENDYLEREYKIAQIFSNILGVAKISINNDDFFAIGGNSILAIKLAHKLSKELGIQISVSDIFKYKTVVELSKFSQKNINKNFIIPNIKLDKIPLSFAQERLWFIEQYEKGSNAYHIPILVSINECINLDAIRQSIKSIVGRHEVLRSVFKQDDKGEDYQEVLDKELVINEYSYKDTDIAKQIDLDINTPFDLRTNYPIRVCIYYKDKDTKLLINIHHIASDGWSTDILLKELNAYYDYYTNDTSLALSDLNIQYKDFAAWQRGYLQGEELDKQLKYWKDRLEGYETLNLPTDYSRPSKIDYSGDNIIFEIDENISNKLREIAKEKNTSLYSLMLSAFYVLLHKYTGQEDIVVGTPIANRHHVQTQDLIGFFVNSLALREHLDTNTTIIGLVKQIHTNLIQAQSHQDLPFEKLVSALDIEQDQSRHPIFQVMFGLHGFDTETIKLLGLIDHCNEYNVAKFDLECFIDDSQNKLKGSFNYATALYTKDTIQGIVNSYQSILKQLVESQDTKIKDYSLLSKEDYQTIVYDWNQTDKEYSKNKTVYQLFEDQVEKNPNNVALVFEDQELTYKQLNERANQLARYIRKRYKEVTKQELNPDTLIPLCLERSLDMIIAILAVMKSGGAYVPMEPEYPAERFRHILTDTDAKLIITQSHLEYKLKDISDIKTISIDNQVYDKEDKSDLGSQSNSTDLAYIIYTSGTTGTPKGVMVEHKSINSLLFSTNIDRNKDDTYAFLSSPIFDASIFEIFAPLISGARLVIPRDTKELVSNIDRFELFLKENNISILWLTKTLFDSIYIQKNEIFNQLKYLLVGGEALDIRLMNKLVSQHSKPKNIINGYGPTESTTFTSFYNFKNKLDNENCLIGKPISNRKVYVLDRSSQPVPIGVVGELYIGGAGLSRGYLNRPELTAERFVPNPFATESDIEKGYTRLYKTGDLVRWLPDGNIEYIGRNDFQVKIRGYRIELGEIESQLSKLNGIRQSVVLAKENTETKSQYLVGYYVSEKLDALKQETLLEKLSEVLPEYMVPSVLVELESFPLTVNGKLDRKALPDPKFVNEDSYVSPITELEVSLCDIFAEVLGLDKVGITDDFFRIGGNSILAIKLSHKLSKELDCQISVADIFINRSVIKLVKYINTSKNLIKKLSQEIKSDREDVFFIHPGAAGCEVYYEISKIIKNYNCYGIDNYNLLNEDKICSITQLAEIYIAAIEKNSTLNTKIYLIGWSLGAEIALQMAYLLEKKGKMHINLLLFDPFVCDTKIAELKSSVKIEDEKNKARNFLESKGYDNNYISKVISTISCEKKISIYKVNDRLKNTCCVLLKAMKSKNENALSKYMSLCPTNNIDLYTDNLRIMNIDSYHSDIVDIVIKSDIDIDRLISSIDI